MPVRCEFTIEQFEEAFQKFAHEIRKFRKVSSGDVTLVFHYDEEEKPRKITVQVHKKTGKQTEWGPEVDWWGFTIERKLYSNSPHSTKIDYGPYPSVEAKVKQFIEEIMDGVKPEPRFSLTKHAKKSNRKLTDYKAFAET
jgi:hypothetical protein